MNQNLGYDTTAQQLFYKREKKQILTGISDVDQYIKEKSQFIQNGGVIEIYGSSGSGKSETVLQILIHSILPFDMGGSEIGVIFFDNDYKFDIFRLKDLMYKKYKQHFQNNNNNNNNNNSEGNCDDDKEFNEFFKKCIGRLHLLRCKDSFQFLVTLKSTSQLIKNIANHSDETNKEVYLMIIDSISAFYWLDQKGEALNVRPNLIWIDCIRKLISEFSLLVIATKQAIFSSSSQQQQQNTHHHNNQNIPPATPHKEFLGNEWSKLVKYRKCLIHK
ncbi:AAA ATPase domain-containing protein [Tieghemostelium lacteum]|uniref:AAA ATPase domain-containing protein n=1 Tax=Tieghemostelium lacteum TaxID=361077 RepID=A0A151Z855_TIELA|nr:AAA ATPase domain-containing protein [Tieghemostelium lacteum]|eukprot:KYQ90131.1 AAA ATPase domain-containing protein [Tieghemostelium lacteum]